MNMIQIVILIAALLVSALILWQDLPIAFPWMINAIMLFVKLFVVLAVTIFAYIFAGGNKNS
mgnify:CR=1 FL=1